MAVTLTDLIGLVNAELENKSSTGSAEAEGDGTTKAFLVAPLGYNLVNDASFGAYINGVMVNTSDYDVDYNTGICTFDTAPSVGVEITWDFKYQTWTSDMLITAVNAGINALFPAMYVEAPVIIDADGESAEYDLDPLVEFVRSHQTRGSGETTWTRRKRSFEIFRDGDHKVIQFFSAPDQGEVRVHAISRPAPLAELSDDMEADSLLPARAMFPVVSYAVYYLLTQKTAPRSRGDVAIATQGVGTLSPRQMNDAANAFYLRYQMQLQSVKMPPWSTT